MSTIEATVSMMEVMPEDARLKVLEFTQALFTSKKPASPFTPLSEEQILADLETSHQQISSGEYRTMDEVLNDLEKRYGFV